jgi:hypothetical protein
MWFAPFFDAMPRTNANPAIEKGPRHVGAPARFARPVTDRHQAR